MNHTRGTTKDDAIITGLSLESHEWDYLIGNISCGKAAFQPVSMFILIQVILISNIERFSTHIPNLMLKLGLTNMNLYFPSIDSLSQDLSFPWQPKTWMQVLQLAFTPELEKLWSQDYDIQVPNCKNMVYL